MRAKEWLKANGFPDISVGKGRMSNEQRQAVEAAVARGVRIDGYSVSSAPTAEPKVERVAVARVIADIGEPTRPEKYNMAYVGKVEVGMRTVCLNCRCSLNYCKCESPRVVVDHNTEGVVTFKSRPDPEAFRNRWW